MRHCFRILIIVSWFLNAAALGGDRPKPVSLVQLIASPERFDGKLVVVTGFLILGEHSAIFMNYEDGRNLLFGNSIWVSPSEQMWRDREKIDLMYVNLTGIFRAPARLDTNSREEGAIGQVRTCTLWSDPNHPIGLKLDSKKLR